MKNTQFTGGCLVGTATYEILATINPFQNETVCELGEPIDLRSLSTSLPAGGEFINIDDLANVNGIINGDQFIPQNATPQNYNVAFVAPIEYKDCGIDTIFFNVDVTQAVVEDPITSTNSYCESIDISSRFDVEFSMEINNRTGRFLLEASDGTVISDGDDFFNPSDIGAGDYTVTFFPADLNVDCNVVPVLFTVDAQSTNVLMVSDTTICQLTSLDLDTLIRTGPKTGTFTSLDGTIGIQSGNIIELPTTPGTFTFEYSVPGDGCQVPGMDQFSITNVVANLQTFAAGLICADTPTDDLNDIFFTSSGLTQVNGTYFLNDGINSPLELTDQMIDYSALAPGAYSIDFTVDDEAVDTGDGCIDLNYTFAIEVKTASAGTAINGSTCPTSGIDLSTFINPDATSGIGTFEQTAGDPIALDATATEIANFTDAMPGDYVFEHIVPGTGNCPSLGDTTAFTVTIEDAGMNLTDVIVPVCDGETTADITSVCTDCSIINTTEDLTAFPIGAVVPGTSVTIGLEYVASTTAAGDMCLDSVFVTVEVMMAGATISDITDAEICPTNTSFNLNSLSSVTGLEWYTSFDPDNPGDNLITTPEMADLTGLFGSTITAVLPDPSCPITATVNVIELSCTTLMIDPIEECRDEVIDLTELPGAAGAEWFIDFTDEMDNVPIMDPTMYAVESNTQLIAAIGTGMTLDTQQVTVTSFDVPAIVYAIDGEPACQIPLANTYQIMIDVGDATASPIDLGEIPGTGSQTGSIWFFDGIDPSLGAFDITFQTADQCEFSFNVDPAGLDCAPAACVLPTELTFDLVDNFVCSLTDFPMVITITDADPNFIYNWLDRDGNVVLMDETSFSQQDTGLLQIQVVDRLDPTCMGIVDSTGILTNGGLMPFSLFGGACVQDSFEQQFIIPEYIGTTIEPTLSMGVGRIELVDPLTGTVELAFATADNMSVEITFPAPNPSCGETVETITAPMDCIADPGCVIPVTTFTSVPMDVCTSADLPLITIDNPDPLFDYIWLDGMGAELDRGVTSYQQIALGEITVRAELITDPTCVDDVGTVGAIQFGQVDVPVLFDDGCDPVAQDTFRASFTVPEYAGTGQLPLISMGTIELVNAMDGTYTVSFATDVQNSIEVTLEPLNPNCAETMFDITADTPCMIDAMCTITPPIFTEPSVCTSADFPVDIEITNPDADFTYTWTETNGNSGTGTVYSQTEPGVIVVSMVKNDDPMCEAEFDSEDIQLGQIAMPVLFDEGCEQDTFRTSFEIPEYAGTGDIPTVSASGNQDTRIEVLNPTTGEFRVSFAADMELEVMVDAASLSGCPSTTFAITAPMACFVDPACTITRPDIIIPDLCSNSDFPVTIAIGDANPLFQYVWLDENGDEISQGTSFSQTETADLSVRVELISDPMGCNEVYDQAGVSQVGEVAEPMLLDMACVQDTFTASFSVPEYVGTTQLADMDFGGVDGRFEVEDTPNDRTFTVYFPAEMMMTIEVTLESLVTGCPATTFTITGGPCMVDANCNITPPTFGVPVLCTMSEFPVDLFIANPDSDFNYTWTDVDGNSVTGTTFSQTVAGVVVVVMEKNDDPMCTQTFDTGVLEVGTPEIPDVTLNGCDQSSFSASFRVPEYGGSALEPELILASGQTGRVEVVSAATGEFEVFFTTSVQNFAEVNLESFLGCPAVTFMIAADEDCMVVSNCDLPAGAPNVSDIGVKPYCDAASANPVFDISNGDFDPSIHGVRWYNDFDGLNQVDVGEQFFPTDVGIYTARFFNLADPSCGESEVSAGVPFDINGDPFFTAVDFCFNAPMPATPSNAGGSFALNPIPTDGATINAETGQIIGSIPNTTYTIQYIEPICNNSAEVDVMALDIPELERIDFACRSGRTEWEVEFISTGSSIEWDAGGFGELCAASSPTTCDGDQYIISNLPVDQDITIFTKFDATDMCAAELFVSAPGGVLGCQCSGAAGEVIPINGIDILNYNSCEPIPLIEVESDNRTLLNETILVLEGPDADTLKVLWYDVATGGMPIALGNTFQPQAPGSYFAEEQWEAEPGMDCRSIRRTEIRVVQLQDLDPGVFYPPLCEAGTIIAPTPNVPGGIFSLESNPSGADINPTTGLLSNLTVGETYVVRYDVSGICPSFSDSTLVYTPMLPDPTVSAPQCNATNDMVSLEVNTAGRVISARPGSVSLISGDDYIIENIPLNTPVEIDVETPGGCGLQTFSISSGEVCTAVDCPEPMFVTGTESPLTFCQGDEVMLAVETGGLGPDDVIEWYTAVDNVTGAPIGAPIIGPSVMPTETSQYFVRVVNAVVGCESGLVSINVIENAQLEATFDYNPTYCVGDIIEPNNFNTNPPTFNTNFDIERTDGTPVTTFFNSTGELLNAEPGEYIVTFSTIENANMCVDTMRQTFEVFDIPINPPSTLILDPVTNLYTFELATNNNVVDATDGNVDLRPDGVWVISALMPGTMARITIENENGCQRIIPVTLPTGSACRNPPDDPVVADDIRILCFDPDLSIDISALGMIRIFENEDRTGFVNVSDLTDFDPPMPGTYYIEGFDNDGCPSVNIDSIVVIPLPMISDTVSVVDPVTGLIAFSFMTEGTPMFDPPTLNLVPDGSGGFQFVDIDPNTTVTVFAETAEGCVGEEISFTTPDQVSTCPDPVVPNGLSELCVSDGTFDLSGLGSVTLYDDRATTIALTGDLNNFMVAEPDTIYVRADCAGTESIGIDSIIFFANPMIINVDSTFDVTSELYTLTFETDGEPEALPAGTVIAGPDANGLYTISDIEPGTTLTIFSETPIGCVSDNTTIQFPNANQCPVDPVIDDLVNQHLVDADDVRQIEYCLSNVAGALPPELEVVTDPANMVEWYEDINGAPIATGISFQPMTEGIYFVRAILAADCVGTFITIELTENTGPEILNPASFNETCDMTNGGYTIMIDAPDAVSIDNMGIGTVSGDAANGWVISGLPAGLSYQFEAIGANGCQTRGQLIIPSDSCVDCTPPPGAPVLVDATQATISVCSNEAYPTLTVEEPDPGFFIQWSMDGQQLAMGSSYTLPDDQMSGTITAVITDGVSCMGTSELEVIVNIDQAPDSFVPYAMTNCLGDGTLPIQPTGSFEPGGMFRLLSGPMGAGVSATSGTLTNVQIGSYSIEYAISNANCASMDTFDIDVVNPDTTFYNVVDFDVTAGTFGIEFGVEAGTTVIAPMGFTLTESNDTFRIMDIPVTDAFDLTLESIITGCIRLIPVSFDAMGCPPIPAPVITSVDPFVFCENDPMSEITATAGADELIIWYDALTGGQEIGRGNFNPQVAGIVGTRTIYAEAINTDTGCPSVMRSSISVRSLEFLETGPDVDLGNRCFRDVINLTSEILPLGNSRFELNSTVIMNDVLETENLVPDQEYVIDYIINNDFCGEDTAQVVVFIEDCRPPADFSSVVTNTLCDDTNDGEFTITITMEQFDLYTYSFTDVEDGVSRPIPIVIDATSLMATVSNLSPGQYEVVAQDGMDVRLRDTITIDSPDPLSVGISLISQTTCNGDTDGSIRADVTGGTGPYIYNWNTGDDIALLEGLGEGAYEVSITDANGCTVDPAGLDLTDADPISFDNEFTLPMCPDQPDGQITFTNVVGGESPLTFFLNNQANVGETFTGLGAGTYFPSIEDARGCRVNGPEIILDGVAGGNNLSLPDEAFANPGEVVTIPLAINFTPTSISWVGQGLSCTDCANPEFTMTDGFRFFDVIVTNETGCQFRADITYFPTPEPSVYIPNAMTRSDNNVDDDFRNDIFFPRVQEGVQGIMSVRIYDRWGGKVHDASGDIRDIETLGWDAQLNGSDVESSVFSYVVRINIENRTETVERTGVFKVFK